MSAIRIRLDLAYDGTGFHGWAVQSPTADGSAIRTVQGVLEAALQVEFRRQPPAPRLVVAGRTDAGVHARGQVAHLDLSPEQWRQLSRRRGATPEEQLRDRLNGIAGRDGDVRVQAAMPAPAGFDARFSAIWRRYEYRVADAKGVQDPLRRHDTVWWPGRLDEQAMDAAAQALVGLHDWAAYCKRPPHAEATTIRDLQGFRWRRDADGVLIASVQADAFCHNMVRSLVGACVAVGEARLDLGGPAVLRDAGVRTQAFKVMPAHGLTLTEVGYPDAAALAARAEQTRGLRTLPE